MEETPTGGGKQNKSTRAVKSLLVHEGAKGLNGAFPREHYPGETVPEMAPSSPDGKGLVIRDQVWIFPGKLKGLSAPELLVGCGK